MTTPLFPAKLSILSNHFTPTSSIRFYHYVDTQLLLIMHVTPHVPPHVGAHVTATVDNTTIVTFPDAFYRVYRMTFSDYTYSEGLKIAAKLGLPAWWNILTFYWLTVGGLILLRILGAMVFSALSQPLNQALLIAYTERLRYISELVMNQNSSSRQDFARFLEMECKPYVIEGELIKDVRSAEREMEKEMERINQRLDHLSDHVFQSAAERSVSSSSGLNI